MDLNKKAWLIEQSLSGSSLFGYVVNEEWTPAAKQPRNRFERASVALRTLAGEHRSGLLFYAFALSAMAAPLWWRRRKIVLFAMIAMTVAWLQMAFTKEAGTGVHHVVLLWPLPHLAIAVVLVEGAARLRRGSAAVYGIVLGILCLSGVLVVNQYLCQFIRNGAAPVWTDAIAPLSNEISRWKYRPILMTDWGMEPTLRMLHEGKVDRLWAVGDVL